jgi:hypothetical protein
MTARTRYFVISSALVTFVGVGSGLVAFYAGFPTRAFSSRGGPEELQYIPADATVVAYADVRHIMASELRQRIRRAILGQDPTRENAQHEFENQTGINIETDIDHVLACLQANPAGGNGPGVGLVLARGTFNEVKIESLMREHGAQVEPYKDKRIIVAPVHHDDLADRDSSASTRSAGPSQQELALAFLKPGLVAIGSSTLIRRAIDLENGGDNVTVNEDVMNLVRSLDSGNAWAVGRFDAFRAVAKLPPGMAQLPPITWFSATGTINDGINGTVRAETNNEEAAKSLRDLIQGFVALVNLQAGTKPELKSVVQSLEISGTGKAVALSFSVPGRLIDLLTPPTGAKPAESKPQ